MEGAHMKLSEKIRQVREERGMTQKEVASLMGISQQAYGQYESGKREPKPETLGRIAAALNVSLNEITDETDIITDSNMHLYIHSFVQGNTDQIQMELSSFYKILYQFPYAHDLWIAFQSLNNTGKSVAVERIQELSEIPRYQDPSSPYSSVSYTETDEDPFKIK